MNRTLSFLALAAVVVVSATPAFARDTRPETDRPSIEQKGDGDSARHADDLRLPRSSRGMQCHIGGTRKGVAYVEVVNDTGKVIPAGSTVTIYTQPGNVQKLFTVQKDWQPGQKLDVPLKGATFAKDETCAVRRQREAAGTGRADQGAHRNPGRNARDPYRSGQHAAAGQP